MAGLSSILGRFRVAMLVVFTLIFAMPAFESHACAVETPSDIAEAAQLLTAAPIVDDGCDDCGPACATSCCHAPHMALMPDLSIPRAARTYQAPARWTHASDAPALAPDGPERPPRV